MSPLDDDLDLFPLKEGDESPFASLERWRGYWFDDLGAKRLSNKTLKGYGEGVLPLLEFSKSHPDVPLEKIGARYLNRVLMHYQLSLAERYLAKNMKKISPSDLQKLKREIGSRSVGKNDAMFTVLPVFENTLSHRSVIIKMFLKFISLNNEDIVDLTKGFRGMSKIVIHDKRTDYLTSAEMKKALKFFRDEWFDSHHILLPSMKEVTAKRNGLLMLLYILTGARSDEVVHILFSGIVKDKNRLVVNIDKGKGGKSRTVFIPANTVEKYLKFFQSVGIGGNLPISTTFKKGKPTGRPMSPNYIRDFSLRVLPIVGIQKRGLHALRRGYVTQRIVDDDASAAIVAKEVGNTVAVLESHYLKYSAEGF